jgi:hypothetical protein
VSQPGTYNFLASDKSAAYKNADLARALAWAVDGVGQNITGYTLTFRVFKKVEDAPATTLLNATTGNGQIVVTNAVLGQFSLAIPASAFSAIPLGVYVYELIATSGAGAISALMTGDFELVGPGPKR